MVLNPIYIYMYIYIHTIYTTYLWWFNGNKVAHIYVSLPEDIWLSKNIILAALKILEISTILRFCHWERFKQQTSKNIGKPLNCRNWILMTNMKRNILYRKTWLVVFNTFQAVNNISGMMINMQCNVTTWNTSKPSTIYQNVHKATLYLHVHIQLCHSFDVDSLQNMETMWKPTASVLYMLVRTLDVIPERTCSWR